MSTLLRNLTKDWGPYERVTLYLDRCQVDTPPDVVAAVWRHIDERRGNVAKVVDFGAGDARFAAAGKYQTYVGYEIDRDRCRGAALPPRASLINRCAFADIIDDADVCIGNPPYVRNQDLPPGWRERAADVIRSRTGVEISGLANAWQYFALLALASTKPNGLVALVIPFEWVSRPSARALRDYVLRAGWGVSSYRLRDETFQGVLTTSSITLIDKQEQTGAWRYFEEDHEGLYRPLHSPSGAKSGVLPYSTGTTKKEHEVFVRRGLSPGTQEILTLTEGERVRQGLQAETDVVRCVTSLRSLGVDHLSLTDSTFREHFRDAGVKCWLIRADRPPSARLKAYLDGVALSARQTRTCTSREEWWRFTMPSPPSLLVASGFRGPHPKAVVNAIGAIAVGGVFGVHGLPTRRAGQLVRHLLGLDLSGRVVSHSKGMRKLEPSQLHALVSSFLTHPIKALQ